MKTPWEEADAVGSEWWKIDHHGQTRYFRRSSIARLYAEVQLIVSHARPVFDPDEIRVAEETEKREPPRKKLLSEEDIVDRAAKKGN